MMQFAHAQMSSVSGLHFYKLLGTGRGNGFTPWPDFTRYAILQVWESEAAATLFFDRNPLFQRYLRHSKERWTLFMRTIKAEGLWSGLNPFEVVKPEDTSGRLAIITRATIRTRKLRTFWNYVPTSEQPLEKAGGLIYTKGIGEVPFLQMATFSLWEDEEALRSFAYQSKAHTKAIQMTRALDWYKEEMFIRFSPYQSVGSWYGTDPLTAKDRLQ